MNDNNPLNSVKQKREQAQRSQEEQIRTQSIIDAVSGSGKATTDALSKSMQNILMATLIGKDPKIAEVASNLTALIQSIAIASKDLKKSGIGELKSTLASLVDSIGELPDRVANTDKSEELIPYLEEIARTVRGINMSPVVSVAAPRIDLKPLEKTIKETFVPKDEGVDLSCFRAHDINNTDPNIQYVGFVAPDGCWYILENNMLDNTIRYKFGKKGYTKAFKDAPKFAYYLLSEAINEIKA